MNWILIANTGNYSYTTDLIQLAIIVLVLIFALFGVVEIIRRTLIKVDEVEEEREDAREFTDSMLARANCDRCKSYFKTDDCIILEMKNVLAREGS